MFERGVEQMKLLIGFSVNVVGSSYPLFTPVCARLTGCIRLTLSLSLTSNWLRRGDTEGGRSKVIMASRKQLSPPTTMFYNYTVKV